MKILRHSYINELMIRRQNGMIKVVTGMRRAGKSFLLLKLFHEKLVEEGVPEDHILELALSLVSLLTFMDCKTIRCGISIFFSRNSIVMKRV